MNFWPSKMARLVLTKCRRQFVERTQPQKPLPSSEGTANACWPYCLGKDKRTYSCLFGVVPAARARANQTLWRYTLIAIAFSQLLRNRLSRNDAEFASTKQASASVGAYTANASNHFRMRPFYEQVLVIGESISVTSASFLELDRAWRRPPEPSRLRLRDPSQQRSDRASASYAP